MERLSLAAVEEAYHAALGHAALPSQIIVDGRWLVSKSGMTRVDGEPVTDADWHELAAWLRGRDAGRCD